MDIEKVLENHNLWSTIGNSKQIKLIQNDVSDITYTDKVMQIGCKNYTIEQWWSLTDNEINDMGSSVLEW